MATDPTGSAPTPPSGSTTTTPPPVGVGNVSLIDRVKNILMRPKTEWPVIAAEPASVASLYRNYIVILAAIPAIAMAVGLLLFGINLIIVTVRPSMGYVLSQAIVSYIMTLVGVFVVALIIEALAPTFGGQKDRVQALKVAAYSYTAAWVAGIVYLVPMLGLLVLLAMIYGFYLMYLGLPVLMKSDPDKTAVYLVAVIVAAIVIYFVIGAVTAAVTHSFAPVASTPSFNLR
jgi:Yip1 domain